MPRLPDQSEFATLLATIRATKIRLSPLILSATFVTPVRAASACEIQVDLVESKPQYRWWKRRAQSDSHFALMMREG